MAGSIDWSEQFKVRLRRNASLKHEVIKLLLVLKLKEKYRSNLYWIRIYTEHEVNNKFCDVYFENARSKEIVCYEIQKKVSQEWLEETNKNYRTSPNPFFLLDWVLLREEDYSLDVESIWSKLDEVVV